MPLAATTWTGRSVFLTGHTGFKGSWFAIWLQQLGATVHGYSLDPPTQPSLYESASVSGGMASDTRAELSDLAALQTAVEAAQPEVVFHLAAQPLVREGYRDPLGTFGTNVMGTAHLLEACRQVESIRAIVLITTDKVYENREWVHPYRESDPLGGHDPYSASKGLPNAGDDRTRRVVDAFSDPRLVYLRTETRLGMSEHWEFALERSSGDWVGVLGDDDGLLPGCARRVLEVAEAAGVDAIASRRCNYTWPGANDGQRGRITIHGGGGSEMRDSKEWLRRSIKEGRTYKDLPGIYTGSFVKRRVMDTIKERTGRYFSSIIPDLYSSVAVASTAPRYYFSHEPIAVSGESSHSTGQLYFRTKRKERNQLAFFSENKLRFHPSLGDGLVRSKSFLVYECFLQSARLRQDGSLTTDLEEQICLALAQAERTEREELVDYFREVAETNGLDLLQLLQRARSFSLTYHIKRKLRKLIRPSRRRGFKRIVESDEIPNVYNASLLAAEVISRQD